MSILAIAEVQQDLAAVGAALRDVTAVIRTRPSWRGRRGRSGGGHGSGIVWSPDGLIVTNAHVATGDEATVELPSGRAAEAQVIARDRGCDLALLRVDPRALAGAPDAAGGVLRAATIGEPSLLRPGELVVALGHPFGVAYALAVGIVHAADARGSAATPRLVRADIRLAPGNSGGPLADVRGRVVGVNAMIVGGLGIAISADEVRRFIAAHGSGAGTTREGRAA